MRSSGRVARSLALGISILAGCGGAAGVVPVTPALVAHAQATSPGATAASLEHGRAVLLDHCGACHSLPDPAQKTVAEWPGTLDDMAKRAGLSQPERDDVQRYLLAAHP